MSWSGSAHVVSTDIIDVSSEGLPMRVVFAQGLVTGTVLIVENIVSVIDKGVLQKIRFVGNGKPERTAVNPS